MYISTTSKEVLPLPITQIHKWGQKMYRHCKTNINKFRKKGWRNLPKGYGVQTKFMSKRGSPTTLSPLHIPTIFSAIKSPLMPGQTPIHVRKFHEALASYPVVHFGVPANGCTRELRRIDCPGRSDIFHGPA